MDVSAENAWSRQDLGQIPKEPNGNNLQLLMKDQIDSTKHQKTSEKKYLETESLVDCIKHFKESSNKLKDAIGFKGKKCVTEVKR